MSDNFVFSLIAGFVRGIGLISILPLGGDMLGLANRFFIGVGLGLLAASNSSVTLQLSAFGLLIEFCIGFAIALPCALTLACAEGFGEFFDVGRGETVGNQYDPLNGVSVSQHALLFKMFVWAVLVFSGVLDNLLGLFVKSLTQVPLISLSGNQFILLSKSVMQVSISSSIGLFKCFLPLGLLFLVIDQMVGFVSKMFPAFSLSSESFQLKSIMGMLVLISAYNLDWSSFLSSASSGLNLIAK